MMLDRDRGLLKTACPRAGGQRGEPVEVDHHRRVVVDLGRLGGLRRLEPARLSIEPGDDGGAGVSHVATDDETVLGLVISASVSTPWLNSDAMSRWYDRGRESP